MANDHDPYGDRNAVPFSQDKAGPGCWQCADCGLIVSLEKKACPSCTDTGADGGGNSAPTAQPSLAAYGAGGQSSLTSTPSPATRTAEKKRSRDHTTPTMHLTGFTLHDYAGLLHTLRRYDYSTMPVADYLQMPENVLESMEPYAILRHDVDRKPKNALRMAYLESQFGMRATYYLRTSTFDCALAGELDHLNHEVGYHYEDYVKAGGHLQGAHDRFLRNLQKFRAAVDVETVAPHGNPLSSLDNLDLFRVDDAPGLGHYKLLGDAYLSIDYDGTDDSKLTYLTDTGREWTVRNVEGVGTRTSDVVKYLALAAQDTVGVYILTHPGRWSISRTDFIHQLAFDGAAELAKKARDKVPI